MTSALASDTSIEYPGGLPLRVQTLTTEHRRQPNADDIPPKLNPIGKKFQSPSIAFIEQLLSNNCFETTQRHHC